jgi:DNA-binding MarR family transcriptional regulator
MQLDPAMLRRAMEKGPSQPVIVAWARLVRACNRLLEAVEGALKAARLPPLSWYDVLYELYRVREEGLRQFEIGARILMSKYNLSRLLDRLEGEGLVRRHACPDDGRGNRVHITQSGTELLRKMWPVYASVLEAELEAALSAREVSTLGAILGKLAPRPESDRKARAAPPRAS